MKKRLAIIASNAGFGGAANILEAFHLCSEEYDPVLITADHAPYDFGAKTRGEKLTFGYTGDWSRIGAIMDNPETYFFIVDLSGLAVFCNYWNMKRVASMVHPYNLVMAPDDKQVSFLIDDLSRRKTAFFWTGSQYLANHERVNEWVRKIGAKRTYAMPDLLRCDADALPLLQPYESQTDAPKYENFTVVHSPGKKLGDKDALGAFWNEKGTEQIARVFDELKPMGINSFILGGAFCVRHNTAMHAKARSHLFVDKISDHSAGVGKSGLEALSLGVPVLCSMHHSNLEGTRYAGMPVINIQTEEELKDAILTLRDEPNKHEWFTIKSKKWAEVINYKNTVRYLEETLVWQ